MVAGAGTIGAAEWAVLQPPPGSESRLPGPPVGLLSNGDATPVGVDPDDLSFQWQLHDPRPGAIQRAYRVVVTRDEPGSSLRTVWDSGEVVSGEQAFVAYRGPALETDTRYRFTVATRDAGGSWSEPSDPAEFVTGLREADWSASWLRPGHGGIERYTYLRKAFRLPDKAVERAVVYAAGAHKYQLWLNGRLLDTGPSFCFPDEQYVQATDVTGAVSRGADNALGFLHHWYGAGKGRPASVPGLLAQLSVKFSDGTAAVVATDRTWRQRVAEWLPAPRRNTDAADFVETIDARATPVGWSGAEFDDSGWEPVAVTGPVGTAPFTRLYAQRTRITETEIRPASVTTLDDGAVVVDFGKVYAARPRVEFRNGIAARIVAMHVGYVLDPDGHVSTLHATQATNLALNYIQRDGVQTFEPYTYLGFRYLEIDAPGEPLTEQQVTAMARHCVMPEVETATFASSDKTLDAVWDLCARSALYATHEQFVDTPTREKGQFLWDACSESQVIMRVNRDQNLTWQALRDFARSQARFWPDGRVSDIYPTGYGAQSYVNFTALYPEWVWRYYLSTHDSATLKALYPALGRVAAYLWKPVDSATGLVTGVPLAASADSNYGYDFDTHCDTSINILTANALSRVAMIASVAGDTRGSSVLRSRSEAVARAVNRYLTRPDDIYVDGLRADKTRSPHASQLANIQALAYGLVPEPKRRTVGEYVAALGISVEPSDTMELVRALHVAGLDADAVRILTDSSHPGYGWILDHGGTFCWEAWVLSDLIGDSMSHGWGSSALVGVQEAILGFTPGVAAAGDPPTMLEIAPAFSVLETATGAVPTMAGTANISWSRRADRTLEVDLSLPPNAAAHLSLPARHPGAITLGSQPLSAAAPPAGITVVGSGSGVVTLRVGAGTYRFGVSGS